MANSYITVDELKAAFPANKFGITYDAVFQDNIDTASREIDAYLKRPPGAFYVTADETRYYNGDGTLNLWVDELAAVPTTVAVAETGVADDASDSNGTYTTWSASDYFCWPYNALREGMPFQKLCINLRGGTKSQWYPFERGIKITGKFGFSVTVPDEIKKATTIQAVRYFKRLQQAFADVGVITELGQLSYVKKLDPDVENILMAAKFAKAWL